MAKATQSLLGFNIVFNGRILLKSKTVTIESINSKIVASNQLVVKNLNTSITWNYMIFGKYTQQVMSASHLTHTLINQLKPYPTLPTLIALSCFRSSLKLSKSMIF